MKIYTEVVYHWDDAKGELVKESEKSFDYQGPLTLCWVQFVPAIIAGVGLAINLYGQLQGQKAREEQNKRDRELAAKRKALAIKSYENAKGEASGAMTMLDNVVGSSINDAETSLIFEAAVKRKRTEGTIKAQGLQSGQSSKFFTDRVTGDQLRQIEKGKHELHGKRVEIIYKKEEIVSGLRKDYLNMEAQIAGLAPVGSDDRSAMYMGMINGGLNAVKTYYDYKPYFQKPSTTTPTTTAPTNVGNPMGYE
tara:strand:+ start:2588 stop:3340 length:753 start_codon:yes stop_codon:yes gene_type:complete